MRLACRARVTAVVRERCHRFRAVGSGLASRPQTPRGVDASKEVRGPRVLAVFVRGCAGVWGREASPDPRGDGRARVPSTDIPCGSRAHRAADRTRAEDRAAPRRKPSRGQRGTSRHGEAPPRAHGECRRPVSASGSWRSPRPRAARPLRPLSPDGVRDRRPRARRLPRARARPASSPCARSPSPALPAASPARCEGRSATPRARASSRSISTRPVVPSRRCRRSPRVRFDRAYPHTLRVFVTPERPVAVVRQGARSFLVSERGRVIARVDRGAPRVARPDLGAAQRARWRPVPRSTGDLATAVAAVAPLAGSRFPGRVTSVTTAEQSLTLRLRSGLELRLGDADRDRPQAGRRARAAPAAAAGVDLPRRRASPSGPSRAPNPQLSGRG